MYAIHVTFLVSSGCNAIPHHDHVTDACITARVIMNELHQPGGGRTHSTDTQAQFVMDRMHQQFGHTESLPYNGVQEQWYVTGSGEYNFRPAAQHSEARHSIAGTALYKAAEHSTVPYKTSNLGQRSMAQAY